MNETFHGVIAREVAVGIYAIIGIDTGAVFDWCAHIEFTIGILIGAISIFETVFLASCTAS